MWKTKLSIFFNFLYNFKRLSLLSILLVVALLSIGIKNFKFDASSDTLVLENDTSFEQYEQTNEKFGESEFLVVAVDNKGSEFNYKFLEKISNLQEKLGALPEVTNALSILDAPLLQQPRVPSLKTDNNIQLLKCKMEAAGHGGMSGRDNAITELAEEYSFILKTANILK